MENIGPNRFLKCKIYSSYLDDGYEYVYLFIYFLYFWDFSLCYVKQNIKKT